MKDDLVSIIIPVYNCEKYIEETIKSVRSQKYNNWELLIVNDCSTDNSLKRIEEQIKDIKKKVKLIDLYQNVGVAEARNIALEQAKGRYIAYLDADDLWSENKLSKQIKFMKEKNIAFSYTGYSRIKGNGEFIKVVNVPESTNYEELLKSTIMLTSTIMINTNFVSKEKLIMPNLPRSEDTQTWLNILKDGVVAYGLNETLTKYRKRKESSSASKIKSLIEIWKVYRKYQSIGIFKSMYYLFMHSINAVKKRTKLI